MCETHKRISELEEMLAHHEKTIEELSNQLAGQWKIIAEMESKMQVLTRRFATLEENSLAAPEITKPPHY
ncbi:MAG: SlyX family protein [Rhizobiaceae bacterium]|nr:SlyX family protein [Rhizobiaceae bacterium]